MSSCPSCTKPSVKEFAPFCSKRCQSLDFNRWFTGAYAVPAVELDDVDPGDLEALGKNDELREP